MLLPVVGVVIASVQNVKLAYQWLASIFVGPIMHFAVPIIALISNNHFVLHAGLLGISALGFRKFSQLLIIVEFLHFWLI